MEALTADAPLMADLISAVSALAEVNVDDLDAATLGEGVVALSQMTDRLRAERARWLRPFERRRGHIDEGAASIVSWAAARCRMSPGAAAEMVTTARHVEELPATARAVRGGEIGYQHASLIAHAARDLGDEQVRKDEPGLVEAARGLDVRQFAQATRRYRECVDPDGALRDANRDHERRRLYLSQTLGGMFRVDGWLDPEGGAVVSTFLNAAAGRPLPDDRRTAAQRRADTLVEALRRQLDGGQLPKVAGQRPHLWVTVPVETLRSEAGAPGGELAWAGPVVGELARRLACDAVCTVMAVGAEGEPLAVGRPVRTILAHVRRQVVARDRGCRFPGCDRPPEWTDIHHLVQWAVGGPSEVANLALLCRKHHRYVHEGGWRMRVGPAGELEFEPP